MRHVFCFICSSVLSVRAYLFFKSFWLSVRTFEFSMRACVSKLVPLLLCLSLQVTCLPVYLSTCQLIYSLLCLSLQATCLLSVPKLVTFLSQFTFMIHDNSFEIRLLSILCILLEKFPFLSTSILFCWFFPSFSLLFGFFYCSARHITIKIILSHAARILLFLVFLPICRYSCSLTLFSFSVRDFYQVEIMFVKAFTEYTDEQN